MPSENISAIPAIAAAIVAHTDAGGRSARNAQAASARKIGPVLISTEALATVVLETAKT